jgi:hypothetical protein
VTSWGGESPESFGVRLYTHVAEDMYCKGGIREHYAVNGGVKDDVNPLYKWNGCIYVESTGSLNQLGTARGGLTTTSIFDVLSDRVHEIRLFYWAVSVILL